MSNFEEGGGKGNHKRGAKPVPQKNQPHDPPPLMHTGNPKANFDLTSI